MLRSVSVFLVVTFLCLAARSASAEDADSSAWWMQATAEDAPEKFHLIPDNTLEPRDWVGLTRDTAFLLLYQVVGAGVLYALPESVSNWGPKAKDTSFRKWWEHVQNPQWDTDDPGVNYVGHTYFGAIYYTRARERGFDRFDSFLYSAFASAMYEFGVEAFFEHPSNQDLIVTPIAGSLVGGFVFDPIRAWVKSKPEIRWYDHIILIATDPIGALNYVAESLLGIKSDIRVGVPRRGGVFVEIRVPW